MLFLFHVLHFFLQDNDSSESASASNADLSSSVAAISKSVVSQDTDNDNEDVFVDDTEVTFRQAHKRFTRPATAMPALNRPQSALKPDVARLNLPVSSPNFQVNFLADPQMTSRKFENFLDPFVTLKCLLYLGLKIVNAPFELQPGGFH